MTSRRRPAAPDGGCLDPVGMTGGRLDASTRWTTLYELLRSHPNAAVLALDDNAFRVPLPDDESLAACEELPGPEKTVMDFVEPRDRMVVVACWERARTVGLGHETVQLSDRPEADHTLTIIDCRERLGVWLELLVPPADAPAHARTPPRVRLPAPSRSRTAVVHKNIAAVITDVDERASSLLGWAPEEMVGRRSLEFVHPEDHERAIAQWLEMRSLRRSQRIRLRHLRRDGSWVWVEIENDYVEPADPDGVVAVARMTDVSEEMAAVEALRRQEDLFRRLTESLPVGIVQIDRGRQVAYANARVCMLLGVDRVVRWAGLVERVEHTHRQLLELAVTRALAGGPDGHVEAAVGPPGDPHSRQCLFTVAALPGVDDSAGALVSVTDVTDGVRLREQLRHRATYDPLTGCLNRAAALTALDAALHGPDASGLAVVFLDLDGFKTVNDTAGHAAGDELLHRVGRRLAELAGGEDRVGRLGGDEFLVLCTGVVDDAGALAAAELVRDRLAAPIHLDAGRFVVRASTGVARARPGATADSLVAEADRAMYRVKQLRH